MGKKTGRRGKEERKKTEHEGRGVEGKGKSLDRKYTKEKEGKGRVV